MEVEGVMEGARKTNVLDICEKKRSDTNNFDDAVKPKRDMVELFF